MSAAGVGRAATKPKRDCRWIKKFLRKGCRLHVDHEALERGPAPIQGDAESSPGLRAAVRDPVTKRSGVLNERGWGGSAASHL